MINEEEKKAIKYFYNLRSTIDESYMLFDEEINLKCGKEMIKQITIFLNLITKLQKENKDIKKRKDSQEKRFKKYKENIEKKHEEIYENLVSENEEKDRQIDLMAEFISKQDVEEEICIKNKTNPDWCNEDYTSCKDCIKQYFERKSKE